MKLSHIRQKKCRVVANESPIEKQNVLFDYANDGVFLVFVVGHFYLPKITARNILHGIFYCLF